MVRITKMWKRDIKWVSAVGKIAPIGLLDTGYPKPPTCKKARTQYMWSTINEAKAKVTQSCLTLCNTMDYTVHGILQARILEWVAFPFFRDRTQVCCIAGGFFSSWAIREARSTIKHSAKKQAVSGCFNMLPLANAPWWFILIYVNLVPGYLIKC